MEKFAIYETKIGFLKLIYIDNVIKSIKFIKNVEDFGIKNIFTDYVFNELYEYLSGTRKEFSFKYSYSGTKFQQRVWSELLKIPYGTTLSYKEIAQKIGNENASRAVGLANNKNPIAIVIPCHRVIGSNSKLIGYAGGLDIKKFLIDLENKNSK